MENNKKYLNRLPKNLEKFNKVKKHNFNLQNLQNNFEEMVNKVSEKYDATERIIDELDTVLQINDEAINLYVSTVSELKNIIEKGEELGIDMLQNANVNEVASQLDAYGDILEEGKNSIKRTQIDLSQNNQL